MALNEETEKHLKASIILEVLGRPPEHLVETLEKLVDQLDKEENVEVIKKTINEPKKAEKKVGTLDKGQAQVQGGEFYTSFVEVEIDVKDMFTLAGLMFKYMPAYVEIISPELIALTNNHWNEILNTLTQRLHGYDEVARTLQVEREILTQKLKELMNQNQVSEKKVVEEKKEEENESE